MSLFILCRLAFRNVVRQRRRSLLSSAVVFFGVFLLITARGLIDGLEYGSVRTQIDTNCGHLRLRPPGAKEDGLDLPLEPRIRHADGFIEKIAMQPHVIGVAPRLLFSTEMSDGRGSLRVVGVGVDPARDHTVIRLGVDPHELGGSPAGIFVGRGLLELFELGPGDGVTLVARTPAGAISALDFVVRGVIATGNPAADNIQAVLSIGDARRLLGLDEGDATEILCRLNSRHDASAIRDRLRPIVGEALTIATWWDATEDVRAVMRIRRKAMTLIVLVIMAIAAAGIANTVLMSIYERVREIGTLTAYGFTSLQIRLLFLMEGCLLGAGGSLCGAIAGSMIVSYFERTGLDLSSLTRTPEVVYPFPEVLFTEWTLRGTVEAAMFGLLVAAAATFLPARRASRLSPVEALRG